MNFLIVMSALVRTFRKTAIALVALIVFAIGLRCGKHESPYYKLTNTTYQITDSTHDLLTGAALQVTTTSNLIGKVTAHAQIQVNNSTGVTAITPVIDSCDGNPTGSLSAAIGSICGCLAPIISFHG